MVSADVHGNETTTTVALDRDDKTVTQTIDYPDSSSNAVNVTVNGLLTASTTKTGLRYTYAYDGLERRTSVADPRTGISVVHYNSKGQVDYVEDAASNRTSYAYDAATGRRTSVTDPLSSVSYMSYTSDGRLARTWGATVHPVSYTYDDFDRMISMSTYRGGSGWSGSSWPGSPGTADTTTWGYDEATGLLTNKVYADGSGPSYTYTSDGKLATRTWARGVTTTYSYDSDTGELLLIDYPNTPDIAFTYDRLGRQKTVSDAQGSRTFVYNDALQLESETNAVAVLTRSYDHLGRNTGFTAGRASPLGEPDYMTTYDYDSVGRFASVSSLVQSASSVVDYGYVPDSDLIASVQHPSHTSHRSYEPMRDLIAVVSNSTISTFVYQNDALGRRTKRIDTLAVTNLFGYNDRSELATAEMGTNSYGYAYDSIGNRESATNPVEVLTYLANQLNQYTSIADGVTNTPTYDADGNLLTYGGWTFTWNGENRLINASNATTEISYSYDYMGRRFQKVVDDGSTVVTNTFLYDGWLLVSEQSASGGNLSTNHYVWGLDLSGSMQGAGGIGGLLSVTQVSGLSPQPSSYFSCFDANGNLTDYIDDTGSNVAHYVYGPFGGTISATGDKADDFKFRFSTKYHDDETGLVYYGLRYYSPELGRWVSRDPIGVRGGANLHAFVNNMPIARVDGVGLLHVVAAKRHTLTPRMKVVGWNIYSELVLQGLADTAAEIAAFGGIDKYGETCKLDAGILRGPDMSVFHHNESLGGPEGPDYGIFWTKADEEPKPVGGRPLGVTKEGVLKGRKPRCKLFWYGCYVKEWLADQKIKDTSWIEADSGPQNTWISGMSVVGTVAKAFNVYRCCRNTADGIEFMRLTGEATKVPAHMRDIPGVPPRYYKLRVDIVKKPGCKTCPVKRPFRCDL